MTIHVVTPEHGTQSFSDADGWETLAGELGDEGNLSITKSEDDEYYEHTIAEFAKGAWLFVYETEVIETEPEGPREWGRVQDIPEGVQFTDRDLDTWVSGSTGVGDSWLNSYTPFTEVLDV